MNNEYWVNILETDKYSINKIGQIKSNINNKILKYMVDKDGYLVVNIYSQPSKYKKGELAYNYGKKGVLNPKSKKVI